MLSATFAILTLLLVPSHAFPSRPGSCNSPQPFGNAHLRNGNFFGGTALSTFGLEVLIGGTTLIEGETFDVPLNTELEIELRATGAPFRGFLLKLNKEDFDTRGMLIRGSPDDNVRDDLGDCENMQAGSLSHRENGDKSSIQGNILIDSEADLNDILLEVTVAIENGARSEWYQSIFNLTASGVVDAITTTVPPPITASTPAATTTAAETAAEMATVAATDAATSAATATTTTRRIGGFDDWFDSLASRFVGTNLRRCFRREGTPPVVGVGCSRTPKTCFFGNQDCAGTLYPDTRCFCDGNVWSCGPSACPLSPTDMFE